MVTQLGARGMGEVHYARDRLLSDYTLPLMGISFLAQ